MFEKNIKRKERRRK